MRLRLIVAGVAATTVAIGGCSSSHKQDQVLRISAMPTVPAGDAQLWVSVNDFVRQSHLDRIKAACGKEPGFVNAVAGPSLIVVSASSLGPAVLTPIESCLHRLPFVTKVLGP